MNLALSLDFIVWSVLHITILFSLYLIWCIGWRNILICLNTTVKKRKLEKIPVVEIVSIRTLKASSWDANLSHPITWMSPVPLVSLIHAVQLEDWAPDHWKCSFHKFPVFSFGLQFCMISLTNLACPVEAGFGHYPWNVHEESIDQLTNYKTTHHFGNPTSAFVNLLLTPDSPATQILAKKIPLHLKVERSLRDCRDCPVSSSRLGSL